MKPNIIELLDNLGKYLKFDSNDHPIIKIKIKGVHSATRIEVIDEIVDYCYNFIGVVPDDKNRKTFYESKRIRFDSDSGTTFDIKIK